MADLLAELLDNPNIQNIAVDLPPGTHLLFPPTSHWRDGDVAAELTQMLHGPGVADD